MLLPIVHLLQRQDFLLLFLPFFATNNLLILSLNRSVIVEFHWYWTFVLCTHQCLHHVGLSVTKGLDGTEDVHHVLVLDHLHQDVAGTVRSAAATAVPRQTKNLSVMSKEETDTEESGETDLAVLHTDIQSTTKISHIQLIWNQPAWEAYKEAFEDPLRSSAMYAYGTTAAARWGNGKIINRSQCFGSSGFSAEKGLRCSVLKHNWFHLHNLFSLPVVGNTVCQFWVMCFWEAMGSEFVPGVPDEAALRAGRQTKPWGKWGVRLKG